MSTWILRTERSVMTVNGKEITVEKLVSENEINWKVISKDYLMVEDIRLIQRFSGFDPIDFPMAKMCFKYDEGYASWCCDTVPTV